MCFQVHSVLWVPSSGCLYTLSTCGLNKWEVGNTTEVQVLSWNACPNLFDSIADAIWVRGRIGLHTLICLGKGCARNMDYISDIR